MSFKIWLTFALASAAIGTIAVANAQDAPQLQLAPTSSWQLTKDQDGCLITREFRHGESSTSLSLLQDTPSDTFLMIVTGKSIVSNPEEHYVLMFGPDGGKSFERAADFTFQGLGPGVVTANALRWGPLASPDPILIRTPEELAEIAGRKPSGGTFAQSLSPEEQSAITWVDIIPSTQAPIRLQVGPMDQPMQMLNRCIFESLSEEGIDIENFETGLRRFPVPTTDFRQWFSNFHYDSKLKSEAYGSIRFRLIVAPDGQPEACRLELSPRSATDDEVICATLLKNARFEPALDAEGRPIRWYYRNGVKLR